MYCSGTCLLLQAIIIYHIYIKYTRACSISNVDS